MHSGQNLHLPLKARLRVLAGSVLVLVVTAKCGWSAEQNGPQVRNSGPGEQGVSTEQSGPPALTIPRLSRAPALEDFLDMKPQGEVALQMAKVTGFTQRNPHDGEKVSEATEAYLGYDQKNLYAVFVCFDDPRQVRARMSVREDIYDDDEVEVMLDTFHDRRRAYAFQTTPLGVQIGRAHV